MIDDNHPDNSTGDDFANDKDVQQARSDAFAYKKIVDDALAILKKKLSAEESEAQDLSSFYLFKESNPTVNLSLQSSFKNTAVYIAIAEYYSSTRIARYANSGLDQYLLGRLTLKKSYPKTYVQKKTIREKIADLLLKQDLKFETSKDFSKKFYVLTKDKPRLLNLLQSKNMDALAAFPDMELELNGNTAMFRCSRRSISTEEAIAFSDLVVALVDILQ